MSANSSLSLEPCSEGGQNIRASANGEWASYNNVDFDGVASFQARVASGN